MSIRNYKVTVNGKSYDVEVEDVDSYPETMSTTSSLSSKALESHSNPSCDKQSSSNSNVTAPLQGMILSIAVKKGDTVKKGDLLLKIEAMKMENEIPSPTDGVVEDIRVSEGDRVSTGDVLLSIK